MYLYSINLFSRSSFDKWPLINYIVKKRKTYILFPNKNMDKKTKLPQEKYKIFRYIQAATSPKDIVILLDASGSMTGQRMEIAKATVEKILDTLSDDDFFNIIWVNNALLASHKHMFKVERSIFFLCRDKSKISNWIREDFCFYFQFSEAPLYVDDCFNTTLVQANVDNKKVNSYT